MKPKTKDQVLWTVSSVISSRQAGLQTRIIKEVENIQCFLRVTAGAGHHKEGAGHENTGIGRR